MIEKKKELIQIADVIAEQFGDNTEVVVHDFTGDLEHTIVYIRNAHVTGREVGGCPTPMFLKYANVADHGKTKLRFISHTSDGKTIRSSTANFFDGDGNLIAGLCINQDISDLIALEKAVQGMSDARCFESSFLSESEAYPTSIYGLLDGIIAEGLAMMGTTPDKMNKEGKIKFLSYLDERGIFLIQKSGQKVCELLGISKFTLYNYLDEVREKK
ncbi:putative transcriptional regulator YheO [Clostridiales Family XIII bacterium PM5-7]